MPTRPRPDRTDIRMSDESAETARGEATPEIAGALAALDPTQRALLDLSLRHGFSDAELAQLLESNESDIARTRASVIDAVAREAKLDTPTGRSRVEQELRAAPTDAWLGEAPGDEQEPDAAATDARPADAPGDEQGLGAAPTDARPVDAPGDQQEPGTAPTDARAADAPGDDTRPGRRRMIVLGSALLALVVAVAVVLLANGEGDSGAQPAASAETEPAGSVAQPERPPGQGQASPVAVPALGGSSTSGSVTARVSGSQSLTVTLEGLRRPSGAYRLWLYDSVLEATPLGGVRSGDGTIRASLPADASDYRYLDLSRERSLTDERHSGLTAFRLPLRPLLSGSGQRQPSS